MWLFLLLLLSLITVESFDYVCDDARDPDKNGCCGKYNTCPLNCRSYTVTNTRGQHECQCGDCTSPFEFTCNNFKCTDGKIIKQNAANIRCTSAPCSAQINADTCCQTKNTCDTLLCPQGQNHVNNADQIFCIANPCSSIDMEHCCRESVRSFTNKPNIRKHPKHHGSHNRPSTISKVNHGGPPPPFLTANCEKVIGFAPCNAATDMVGRKCLWDFGDEKCNDLYGQTFDNDAPFWPNAGGFGMNAANFGMTNPYSSINPSVNPYSYSATAALLYDNDSNGQPPYMPYPKTMYPMMEDFQYPKYGDFQFPYKSYSPYMFGDKAYVTPRADNGFILSKPRSYTQERPIPDSNIQSFTIRRKIIKS